MGGIWQPLGFWAADSRDSANSELIWSTVALVGIMVLGTAAIAWVKRWRARRPEDELTPAEQEAHYRVLLAQGEISREELERITGILQKVPARAPTPAEPPQ